MQLTCDPVAFQEDEHPPEPAGCSVPYTPGGATSLSTHSTEPFSVEYRTNQLALFDSQFAALTLSASASRGVFPQYFRCMACSFLLHAALVSVAIIFFVGGGSGGQGAGTGTGLGDGSGGSAMMVTGYVRLERGGDTGQTGGAALQPHPPEEAAAIQESQPQMPETQEAMTQAETSAPAEKEQLQEIPAKAVPVLSQERTPKQEERGRRTTKPTVTTSQRGEARQARPVSRKEAISTAASAGTAAPGVTASQDGKGHGAGQASSEGVGQNVGSGGSSSRLNAGGSGVPGFGYALNMVDQVPKLLKRGPMPYPESARKNRLTGNVTVRFLLSEKGEMSRMHIIQANPPDIFDSAALVAVKKWKFAPAVKDGKPVPVWVDLPLHFSLR